MGRITGENFEIYPLYVWKNFEKNFYVGAACENFEIYPLYFWKNCWGAFFKNGPNGPCAPLWAHPTKNS